MHVLLVTLQSCPLCTVGCRPFGNKDLDHGGRGCTDQVLRIGDSCVQGQGRPACDMRGCCDHQVHLALGESCASHSPTTRQGLVAVIMQSGFHVSLRVVLSTQTGLIRQMPPALRAMGGTWAVLPGAQPDGPCDCVMSSLGCQEPLAETRPEVCGSQARPVSPSSEVLLAGEGAGRCMPTLFLGSAL